MKGFVRAGVVAMLAAAVSVAKGAHAQEPAPPAGDKPTAEPPSEPEKPAEPAPSPSPEPAPPASASSAPGPSTQAAPPPGDVQGAKPPAGPTDALATNGSEATHSGPAVEAGDWHFDFHGYVRAPMRVGIGHNDKPAAGQPTTSLHAPVIPDDQYLSWQHTRHNEKDWAELFFSYGNSWARGTVGLQGFDFTDAAWTDSPAQFGISQGWITLTPDLGYENVRLTAKVGSFWNKYGTAGRYDAGEYDTYLFGRTHAMGETVRAEIDVGDVTLGAEQGFGTKKPDPSTYNEARFTLLHHEHVDASFNKTLTLGLHYLYSWTAEEDRTGLQPGDVGLPDGSMGVYGGDVRLDANAFGYLYLGFSHISASDALTVAPAIEVLHAYGGGEFTTGLTNNQAARGTAGTYLDTPGCSPVVPGQAPAANRCSGGNGSINSVLAQYEFSVANFITNTNDPTARFWGEGPDLVIKIYGMYNKVSSLDPNMDGVSKLKYGTDVAWSALPWFGVAVRADRVQPNSNIPEQSFAILSPRVFFRSRWVTHEEIQLQYSRYFYNQRTCVNGNPANDGYEKGQEFCVQPPGAAVTPDGFGAAVNNQNANTRGAPTTTPDVNVIKLQASMWW